jgi:hypothetical protein
MIVRLTIQQDGVGFRAMISKRDDQGSGTIGAPEIFLVDNKDEAKKRAKEMARGRTEDLSGWLTGRSRSRPSGGGGERPANWAP